jgi:hypothetical protein
VRMKMKILLTNSSNSNLAAVRASPSCNTLKRCGAAPTTYNPSILLLLLLPYSKFFACSSAPRTALLGLLLYQVLSLPLTSSSLIAFPALRFVR